MKRNQKAYAKHQERVKKGQNSKKKQENDVKTYTRAPLSESCDLEKLYYIEITDDVTLTNELRTIIGRRYQGLHEECGMTSKRGEINYYDLKCNGRQC